MNSHLQQAINYIKSGDLEKGKQLLIQILRKNPKDENAWLWMSKCVPTVEEKRRCFKQVLKINPSNEIALQALNKASSPPVKNDIPVQSKQQTYSKNTPRRKATKREIRTKPKKKGSFGKIWLPIIIALISCLGAVGAAFVGSDYIKEFIPSFHPQSDEFVISVHVADDNGKAIAGAKALFFYPAGSLSQYTDSNGVATFSISDAGQGNLRLIVETNDYQIYEKQILYPIEKSVDIRLNRQKDSEEKIILRTVSENNSAPISNIDVVVAHDGDIYHQATDSDGFALLTLPFPSEGKIDVQISVNAQGYNIENQFSTLTPGKLQYISLTPQSLTVEIPDIPLSIFTTTSSDQITNPSEGVVGSGVDINQLEGTGLRVVFLTPDSQPWEDAKIYLYEQKEDANGNPSLGSRVAYGYIDAQGILDFDASEGFYVICPEDGKGYGWTKEGCVYNVHITDTHLTEVRFQVGKLQIAVVNAAGQPWEDIYCNIYTQTQDISGNPVTDEKIRYGYTDNTGILTKWFTPGVYAVSIDLRGYNWGILSDKKGEANIYVQKGNTTSILIEMGQLIVGQTKTNGDPNSNVYIQVYTQEMDVNGNPSAKDKVGYGYTDDGGILRMSLTEGMYAVKIGDSILYDVPISWGNVTQTDGTAFQQVE